MHGRKILRKVLKIPIESLIRDKPQTNWPCLLFKNYLNKGERHNLVLPELCSLHDYTKIA